MITAIKWTGNNSYDVFEFVGQRLVEVIDYLMFETVSQGVVCIDIDDWIIKQGDEFIVCKEKITGEWS